MVDVLRVSLIRSVDALGTARQLFTVQRLDTTDLTAAMPSLDFPSSLQGHNKYLVTAGSESTQVRYV